MTSTSGRVRVEDGHKRVRGYLGGELVFDTIHPKYVWEIPYYPAYYLPEKDVRTELLASTDHTDHSPSRGDASFFTITAGGKTVENAAWQYTNSPFDELRDHIRFEWSALDAWFEEDDEVIVHPRNPYSRVDVLRSSRHVQVIVDGTVIAESTRPTLLFETGLPARFYFPKPDVRFDLLEETDASTQCPYKGTARYWSVRVGDGIHADLAWSYPAPLPESAGIAGLVSFYNEKVDLIVDGESVERPKTPFS